MNIIKQLAQYKYDYAVYVKDRSDGIFAKIYGIVRFASSHKIAKRHPSLSSDLEYAYQFKDMAKLVNIHIQNDYVYPLDESVVRSMNKKFRRIASVTVDYSTILNSSIKDKRNQVGSMPDGDFKTSLIICLDAIECYIERICSYLKRSNNIRSKLLLDYFTNMYDKPAQTFDEAIQRILFYNALFWQCSHMQNGIGRLDLILAPYYNNEIATGTLTRNKAKAMLWSVVQILGSNTAYKSAGPIGDTGQVIILGGVDREGKTVDNDITQIFCEIFEEHPVPDPKLILRVNKHTSDIVWQKAIASIIKGSGSPLIMNEELIIPKLIDFGYDKDDVWNVGTSACWEPLIIGKSLDQNNCIPNIPIIESLRKTILGYKNKTYSEFISNLDNEINSQISGWNLNVCFDYSPLLSLYFDDCIEKNVDFTKGGATYNYHGLLVTGMPNLVNAVLNVKQYVFDTPIVTLDECKAVITENYQSREDLLQLFKNNKLRYGSTEKVVVDLTNHLMTTVGNAVEKREMFGKKIKVGFSSPGYINIAKKCVASLDGRKDGEPFGVHISPISSDIDIAEILDFASMLKYDGCCINGNVVDFIIPSSYAKQPNKLASYVRNACDKGLYELQLNVLDKKTLIDAKAHPEKYPNLVVRVWGFSAYFNDLPEEYKDNLIARAEIYEA